MGKILKPGRVVVVLAGRYAGKKAVILSAFDAGTKDRKFGYAMVVGISNPPRKVNKRMSAKKIDRRCNIKTFIKPVCYTHLMPTRYTVSNDVDIKSLVGEGDLHDLEVRKEARKKVAVAMKARFLAPQNEKTGKVSKDLTFLRKRLRF